MCCKALDRITCSFRKYRSSDAINLKNPIFECSMFRLSLFFVFYFLCLPLIKICFRWLAWATEWFQVPEEVQQHTVTRCQTNSEKNSIKILLTIRPDLSTRSLTTEFLQSGTEPGHVTRDVFHLEGISIHYVQDLNKDHPKDLEYWRSFGSRSEWCPFPNIQYTVYTDQHSISLPRIDAPPSLSWTDWTRIEKLWLKT